MAQTRTGHRNGGSDENPMTDRLTAMAHETVDQVSTAASRAEQQVRGAAARTAEQAKEYTDQAAELADEGVTKVKSYVETNPLMAAGIAFAAGVIISSLIRR